MTTPGSDRLDGGPANAPWPFRPTELYRKITAPFQRATKRTAGPKPGQPWDSASTLDEITCLAEDLSVVYVDPNGQEHTLSDVILSNYLLSQQIYGLLTAITAHLSTQAQP